MARLLKQVHPRVAVLSGCAILLIAGMTGLLAWAGMVPPRGQLRLVTGQLQELVLKNAHAGAFKITLASGGALQTFEFKNAHRLVALLPEGENTGGRQINPAATVTLAYYPFGRWKEVVDVTLGEDNVLNYEDVASLAAQKAVRDRNAAIGLGALGAFLIFLGGAARIARGRLEEVAAPNLNTTGGEMLVVSLILFGGPLAVILAEPAALHRAFGVEAFHLPIEFVLPAALALLFFLPLWLGSMGLSALVRRAMRNGRHGEAGLIWEIGSLCLFIYPILFWIVYAAVFGSGPPAP
ncbi:MAG TPA: hypothetical protein VE986_05370 [Hyphomicrobiales bacterium]|nr:hypothetical protein [Hyphomicrobiales bacterium]